MISGGEMSLPFLRSFFAPDKSEVLVDKFFNFLAIFLPAVLFWHLVCRKKVIRRIILLITALLLLGGFIFTRPVMDRRSCREISAGSEWVLTAPIPYSPDESCGEHYQEPDREHIAGCDEVGRDLASRLIYGTRVSLAVGLLATVISLITGLAIGMSAGFFRGWFDLLTMRVVEVLSCFPTFLLLLILMSMLGDLKIAESIPLVIAVIGLASGVGLAFLVRGETLRESSQAYVQSCIVSGVPAWKIMVRHLLPNIAAPVLISFTFGVAGAIGSESGLSFLGFGVQPPSASWGNLLRQALDNPLEYWHLMLFPGLTLFIAVLSLNFAGEGLRRAFDVKEQ
jgi:peptide/nickel transport system permease protein